VRGYLPLDPNVAPTPQLVAANQALKLQELALRKQELLFELQGYQVNRVAGETSRQVDRSSPCESRACFDCCCILEQHSAHHRMHIHVAILQEYVSAKTKQTAVSVLTAPVVI
jgi:hypothetical protein